MNLKNESFTGKMHLKPIKDRVYWLVRAKKLFKMTHQKMGLEENRLLFYLLKNCTVQTDRPYVQFSESSIRSAFGRPDQTNGIETLKANLLKIRSYPFWITSNDTGREEDVLTSWIQSAAFDQAKSEFIVVLSSSLYPYIVCLHDIFQTMDYKAMDMDNHLKSKYSSRLYELFKIHETLPELTLTLDQLRYLTDVEKGKLERWVDLKRRVIEPSLEDVNQTGEFSISYQTLKTGRSVTQIRFLIHPLKPDGQHASALQNSSAGSH